MKSEVEILDDLLFGRLHWDRETQWWEGSVPSTARESFTLSVQPHSGTDRTISAEARHIFAQVCSDLEGIRRRALQEFLTQARSQSFFQGLTLEQLLTHLRPDAIMVRADGYLEVGFADREERVFGGGHGIVSRFWPNGTRDTVLEG